MSVVVIPCFSRADFLEVCLDHIVKADDFDKHKYLFCLDYGFNPEVLKIINKYPLMAAAMKVPDNHLKDGKQSYNVINGLIKAAEVSDDKVYYIEDDCLIAKDFFTFTGGVVEKEDVYCCIASMSDRPTIKPVDDGNCYYVKENDNDYRGIGVCFSTAKILEYLKPHHDMRYYRNIKGYCTRFFPDSELKGQWTEQDGLQRRIIEKNKLMVAFSSVPRCFHAGFYGYHRSVKVAYDVLSHEDKVKFIYDHVFDLEKVKSISNNTDWIQDSIPVNLNTNHDTIINQNEKK
jgi:hypothetical protein